MTRGNKLGMVKEQRKAYTEIGDYIKKRLIVLNITIENFATIFGVSNVYVVNLLQGKRHFPEKHKNAIREKLFFTEKEKKHLDILYEREETRWKKMKLAGKKRLSKVSEINSKERIVKEEIINFINTVREEEKFCKENERPLSVGEVSDYKQKLIKLIIEA